MGMENKLKFTKTGPESGDCTAPYEVAWNTDGRRSVSGFVAAVLRDKSDEWGSIYLIEDDRGWMHAPSIEYKYGSVVSAPDSFFERDDDREIDTITARGGWTNMDYYVRFKAREEGTKEPAEEERRDDGEATKEQQRREKLEKNIAESIRAVAEHVIANADTWAMGVSDDARGIEIKMTFNINEVPTVTFTQDVCPRTWVNAVRDGRCRVWTKEGRRELAEPMEEGLYCVDVAVFKGETNAADRDVSVKVWARDRDEAAQKAREIVGGSGEWVKVLRMWRKQK